MTVLGGSLTGQTLNHSSSALVRLPGKVDDRISTAMHGCHTKPFYTVSLEMSRMDI